MYQIANGGRVYIVQAAQACQSSIVMPQTFKKPLMEVRLSKPLRLVRASLLSTIQASTNGSQTTQAVKAGQGIVVPHNSSFYTYGSQVIQAAQTC
jgi:hypothetical protein